MKKMQQGFTLIELMIVVAIIAILAAIALPAYRDYTVKAKITNAIGGLAGEKIKVGENFGSGADPTDQAAICNGVADNGVTCAANGVLTAVDTTDGSVSVELTPTFPEDGTGDRITWECEPTSTTYDLSGSNTPTDCPAGGGSGT